MSAKRSLAALLGGGVLFGLGACGGGDATTSPSTLTLSGKVIDGYIENATVCLDLNNNFQCDTSNPLEPSAITKPDGSYSIKYSGSIAGVQVLAVVGTNAWDKDLGAITKPYVMLAPAERSNAITPMSTLVSSEMIASKATADDAAAAIKTKYNLTAEPLNYDFIENKDQTTTDVAQKVAASIAAVNKVLSENSTIQNSGITSSEVMKAAIQQVKDDVLLSIIKTDGTVDKPSCVPNCKQEDLVQELNDEAGVVIGRVQDIVYNTRADDGSLADAKKALEDGLIFISNQANGDYIDAAGNRVDGHWSGYANAPIVDFNKLENGVLSWYDKVYVNNVWFKNYDTEDLRTYLDGSQWIEVTDSEWDKIPLSFSNNCASRKGSTYCLIAHDLSNKKLGEFSALCDDSSGNKIISCKLEDAFPAGSIGYDFSKQVNADSYEFSVGDWSGYMYSGPNATSSPSLDSFISVLQSSTKWIADGGCNVRFKIGSISDDKTKGEMQWQYSTGASCNDVAIVNSTETSNFIVKEVAGKKLMIVDVPSIYRAQKRGDIEPGCKIIFGVAKNILKVEGMFDGKYCPANAKSLSPFINSDSMILNKTLLDFILKERGMTPFAYN